MKYNTGKKHCAAMPDRAVAGVSVQMWMVLLFFLMFTSEVKATVFLQYQFKEETGANFPVGDIHSDAGLADGTVKYVIDPDDDVPFPELFRVDDTGHLVTIKNVDRDSLSCSSYSACLIPLQIHTELTDTVTFIQVEVEVIDINDNSPVFPDPVVYLPLEENTHVDTLLPLPIATDPDSVEYSILDYQLLQSVDTFRLLEYNVTLGPEYVYMVLERSLDREHVGSYQFTLLATDGGTPARTGSTIINITVVDINDNLPEFENQTYEVKIPEDTADNTVILQVKATDKDTGEHGKIIYSFSPKTEADYGQHFLIDHDTGDIIVLGNLDYDLGRKRFYLTVRAQNQGATTFPGSAVVLVILHDVNDNAPTVKVNALGGQGQLWVMENAPNGTLVGHMTAKDKDEGVNGLFQCTLESDDFTMKEVELGQSSSKKYTLYSNREFDRETLPKLKIEIICEDFGELTKSSVTEEYVYIGDVNDNSPYFTGQLFNASIMENSPPDTQIIKIVANDADEGDNANITYTLVEGPHSQYIGINAITGDIYSRVRLDREETAVFNINVTARDHGHPVRLSTWTMVQIIVGDQDDYIPRFINSTYTFSVLENRQVETRIGTVTAVDLDLPPYNDFTYSLLEDFNQQNLFRINTLNGDLLTRAVLDREDKDQYTLVAVVESLGIPKVSASATINIHVMDVNDEAPVFVFPGGTNNTFHVLGPLLKDGIVTRVTATDADAGGNAHIVYSIESGDDNHLFFVNPETGDLRLLAEVSFLVEDSAPESYTLLIQAKDMGSPPKRSSSKLELILNKTAIKASSPDYSPSDETLSKTNLTIIVVICSITGLLIILLIILILCVVRRHRKSKARRKYKHAIQVQLSTRQALGSNESIEEKNRNADQGSRKDPQGFINQALNLDRQDFPADPGGSMEQQMYELRNAGFHKNGGRGGGGQVPLTRLSPGDAAVSQPSVHLNHQRVPGRRTQQQQNSRPHSSSPAHVSTNPPRPSQSQGSDPRSHHTPTDSLPPLPPRAPITRNRGKQDKTGHRKTPHKKIVYESEHTIHKPLVIKVNQDHRLLTPSPHLDNNSDSGCSVATDSGRGSHAESTGGGDVIITSSLPNDRLDETGMTSVRPYGARDMSVIPPQRYPLYSGTFEPVPESHAMDYGSPLPGIHGGGDPMLYGKINGYGVHDGFKNPYNGGWQRDDLNSEDHLQRAQHVGGDPRYSSQGGMPPSLGSNVDLPSHTAQNNVPLSNVGYNKGGHRQDYITDHAPHTRQKSSQDTSEHVRGSHPYQGSTIVHPDLYTTPSLPTPDLLPPRMRPSNGKVTFILPPGERNIVNEVQV